MMNTAATFFGSLAGVLIGIAIYELINLAVRLFRNRRRVLTDRMLRTYFETERKKKGGE